jgi:hypothetical protein
LRTGGWLLSGFGWSKKMLSRSIVFLIAHLLFVGGAVALASQTRERAGVALLVR